MYREYQQKIKAQRKKQKRLLEEQRQKEEEMMSVSRQYKDAQEEVAEGRKVIEVLKRNYAQALRDLKDLKEE